MPTEHTVIHYLDKPSEPYFKDTCWRLARDRGIAAVGVATGRQLLNAAKYHPDHSVSHHIIGGHGGSTWLLNSRHGVSVARTNKGPHQVDLDEFVDTWGPKYTKDVRISLAACMCSRSPHWYLKSVLGQVVSAWGPRSYRGGGQASFSAKLRDRLIYDFNVFPDVRGHRSEGDMTFNALVSKHTFPAGETSQTLFELCFPDLEPIQPVRLKWTRKPEKGGIVLGPRAERWLLHDDTVIDEIRALW